MAKRLLYAVVLGAIISPLVIGCASSNPKQSAVSSASSSEGLLVSFDIDLARDERELVHRATLVAHVIPVGQMETVVLGREGLMASYYQDVRVIEVLKGQAPGGTARVVTTGIITEARARLESKPGVKIIIEDEEDLNGPLAPGEQILFLQPSAKPGVFQGAGLRQGIFPLDARGRIASAHEFKSFVGLDVAGVRQKIEELSQ